MKPNQLVITAGPLIMLLEMSADEVVSKHQECCVPKTKLRNGDYNNTNINR